MKLGNFHHYSNPIRFLKGPFPASTPLFSSFHYIFDTVGSNYNFLMTGFELLKKLKNDEIKSLTLCFKMTLLNWAKLYFIRFRTFQKIVNSVSYRMGEIVRVQIRFY